jgi:hypothetical protein
MKIFLFALYVFLSFSCFSQNKETLHDSLNVNETIEQKDSSIFLTEIKNDDIGMKLFPNPAYKNTTLQLRLRAPQFLTIDLTDVNGIVVKTIISKQYNGQDPSIYIETSGLPAGDYLVRVLAESGNVIAGKVLKVMR